MKTRIVDGVHEDFVCIAVVGVLGEVCLCRLFSLHLSGLSTTFVGNLSGHVDPSALRNSGPSFQNLLSVRYLAERPLVGRSAGFSFPGTWSHCSESVVRSLDFACPVGHEWLKLTA